MTIPDHLVGFADNPEVAELLPKLSIADQEWLALEVLARPEQKPPHGDWLVWFMLAGRGGGKNWGGARWVIKRAKEEKGPIGLVGETSADVRDVMVEKGPSSILNLSPPDFVPKYEPSKRRLTWPNGVTATTYSGDEPDQLRGPEHQTIWGDEIAKWKRGEECWDNVMMGLRYGKDPRACLTSTPRPTALVKALVDDPTTVIARWSSYDNLDNVAPTFKQYILDKYEGTRLGRQELHAEILTDTPGALWTTTQLEGVRLNENPDPGTLKRVVIGVDPAGGGESEIGIIVAAKRTDAKYVVLQDYSLHGSPNTWAKEVQKAYTDHIADKIVAERNYGGDMVESTMRTVAPDLPVDMVSATRGKKIRAEPIAALYEQGKVFHAPGLSELEDQQATWNPDAQGKKSPDRVDALVWALTELSTGLDVTYDHW